MPDLFDLLPELPLVRFKILDDDHESAENPSVYRSSYYHNEQGGDLLRVREWRHVTEANRRHGSSRPEHSVNKMLELRGGFHIPGVVPGICLTGGFLVAWDYEPHHGRDMCDAD
jgi:hypothetical protein